MANAALYSPVSGRLARASVGQWPIPGFNNGGNRLVVYVPSQDTRHCLQSSPSCAMGPTSIIGTSKFISILHSYKYLRQ
ncbi:hypothetical protein RSAG8_02676, partial [Rhizoctonia solani AG-8 WAC10335]